MLKPLNVTSENARLTSKHSAETMLKKNQKKSSQSTSNVIGLLERVVHCKFARLMGFVYLANVQVYFTLPLQSFAVHYKQISTTNPQLFNEKNRT